jgi:hypothetical protein
MPKALTQTQKVAQLIADMMPYCPPVLRERAGLSLGEPPFAKPRRMARGELFSKLLAAAKANAMNRHGPRYMFRQVCDAGRWGRLKKDQASYKSERGTTIRMPRDQFIPHAEFWPGGIIPHGVEISSFEMKLETCTVVPELRDRDVWAVWRASIKVNPEHADPVVWKADYDKKTGRKKDAAVEQAVAARAEEPLRLAA